MPLTDTATLAAAVIASMKARGVAFETHESIDQEASTQAFLEDLIDEIRQDLIDNLGAAVDLYQDFSQSVGAGPTVIDFNVRRVLSGSYFSESGTEVTIDKGGRFRVDFSVGATSSVAAAEIKTALQLDSGSGFADVPGVRLDESWSGSANQRGGGGAARAILDLNAGDKLRVEMVRVGGSGDVTTLPDSCSFTVTTLA